jgi:hypothetical protein
MNAKLDQYGDVIQRLGSETLQCCPPSWERGTLSIQSDGVRITYQLKSDDSAEKASISQHLRDLIDELYVRMSHNGHVWREAFFHWWRDQGDLKFRVDFDYAGAPEPIGQSVSERAKRSWLKWLK